MDLLTKLKNKIARSRAARRVAPDRQLTEFKEWDLAETRHEGISKSGNPRWYARAGDKHVKIYKVDSQVTAQFVQAVSGPEMNTAPFPGVLDVNGTHVLAEWITGTEPEHSEGSAAGLGAVLASIHNLNVPDITGFDYPNYVGARLRTSAGPFVEQLSDVLVRGRRAFESLEALGHRVCHPDLTLRNVVVDPEGTWWSIDNEYLGAGSWYPVDLLNAISSFSRNRKMLSAFFTGYASHGGDLASFNRHSSALTDIWELRVTGSLLQADAVSKVLDGQKTGKTQSELELLFDVASTAG